MAEFTVNFSGTVEITDADGNVVKEHTMDNESILTVNTEQTVGFSFPSSSDSTSDSSS